jgi:hypothetical protein
MQSPLRLVALVLTITLRAAQSRTPSIARLCDCLNPQILAPLGPEVSEIGMGERFRLIAAQQRDVAGCGLLFQPVKAQPGAVNRVSIPGLRRGRLCRPLSVCRGRRQAKPLFSAPR